MENLLFLGVPILKHIRVIVTNHIENTTIGMVSNKLVGVRNRFYKAAVLYPGFYSGSETHKSN